jgi:hypothetical protein
MVKAIAERAQERAVILLPAGFFRPTSSGRLLPAG